MGDQCSVHVHFSIAKGVPNWIASDRRRLTQVLLNLASNAVKYTASGGEPVLDDKQYGDEKVGCNQKQKKNVDLMLQYLPVQKSINMHVRDTGGI